MVLRIASVVLMLLLPGFRVEDHLDYEDISEQEDRLDYVNYDVVDEEAASSPSVVSNDDDVIGNRIRREQDEQAGKSIKPEDVQEVKKVISDILSGIRSENPFTPYLTSKSLDSISTHMNTSPTPLSSTPVTSSLSRDSVISYTTEEKFSTLIFTLLDTKSTFSERKLPTRSSKSPLRSSQHRQSLRAEDDQETTTPDTTTMTQPTTTTTQQPTTSTTPTTTRTTTETTTETTTPTTPPTTNEYDGNYTGVTIAKCFVCGLEAEGIPRNAHCADAFAGDFMPVVPVDFSAKRRLQFYRKQCKYRNIRNFRVDEQRPRVVWGRWTGGCAVRWADLTGVYTQRTCRNRMMPSTGRHFASKRMAKLERALWNLDNGCIVSPAASLTPMSRGVSLYARFHACVCSGSWCNASPIFHPPRWSLVTTVVLLGSVCDVRFLASV